MPNQPFRDASAARMQAKIDDLCIDDMDKQIVRMRIIGRKKWVEIGAEVGCDRRTASRHFDSIKDLI